MEMTEISSEEGIGVCREIRKKAVFRFSGLFVQYFHDRSGA